jgi:beta-lactamase superfamily II metal-dependent hydrolase
MAFEIDFLPVGNGDRSGDAISVRYGQPGAYTVMVYDGGTQESGSKLVEHIREYYQTDYVDHVVNSHPDADHVSGLSVVLEQLTVGTLWLHRPWLYSHVIIDYFKDGRITNQSLKTRLQENMAAAYQLEQLAIRKRIEIKEPFRGEAIGAFHVLSPDKEWYVHDLIANFEKSPEQIKAEAEASLTAVEKYLRIITEGAKKGAQWVAEKWDLELLREDVETTGENESSAILYAYMQDHQHGILLTGDAGVKALGRAVDCLNVHNVSAPLSIKFVQVPHHGSRHNVSSSILDRILGPKLPVKPEEYEKVALVSVGKDSTTHPRKMVVNAFFRRGAKVIATQGKTTRHHRGMPAREGWVTATPLEFSNQVEAWE